MLYRIKTDMFRVAEKIEESVYIIYNFAVFEDASGNELLFHTVEVFDIFCEELYCTWCGNDVTSIPTKVLKFGTYIEF